MELRLVIFARFFLLQLFLGGSLQSSTRKKYVDLFSPFSLYSSAIVTDISRFRRFSESEQIIG